MIRWTLPHPLMLIHQDAMEETEPPRMFYATILTPRRFWAFPSQGID